MAIKEVNVPVISIQCDWENTIFTLNKEVWISCKFRGTDSTHGKLKSNGSNLPTSLTDDFKVLECSERAIHIQHTVSKYICVFVPASKQFSIHKKGVLSLDVSNGSLGVSVCSENNLQVWDRGNGRVLRSLTGHVGDIYKSKLFPSGIVVLTCSADMRLKIWSAETGQCPVTLTGHVAPVTDISIIDKGRNIISVSKDGTARLWDCGQSQCLGTLADAGSIINCCDIGIINPRLKPNERNEPINSREIGTEDKILLVGTEEGSVLGISVYHRDTMFNIQTGSAVNVLLYISEECFVVGCQDGKLIVYNPCDVETPIKTIHESNSPVISGCCYKTGFLIGRNDGTIIYYDHQTWSDVRLQLTGSDYDPIYDIASCHDGVYTACRDGNIRKYALSNIIDTIF